MTPEELNIKDVNTILDMDEVRAKRGSTEGASFHSFPKLPMELKLKIWEKALPGPAIVEVLFCPRRQKWFCPQDSVVTSSMLSVNQQTRQLFQKHYKPFLTVHSPRPLSEEFICACNYSHTKRQISYFDAKIDTLFIGHSAGNYFDTIYNEKRFARLASLKALDGLTAIALHDMKISYPIVPTSSAGHIPTDPGILLKQYFPDLRSFVIGYDQNQYRYRGDYYGDIDVGIPSGDNRAVRGNIELVAFPGVCEAFSKGEDFGSAKESGMYLEGKVTWLRDVAWKDLGLDVSLKLLVRGGARMLQYQNNPPPQYVKRTPVLVEVASSAKKNGRNNIILGQEMQNFVDLTGDDDGVQERVMDEEVTRTSTRGVREVIDLTED